MKKNTATNPQNPEFLQSPWKAYWFSVQGVKGKLAVLYLLMIVGNVGSYSVPYFLKLIVDRISAPGPAPSSLRDFLTPIILIVGVLVVQEISYRISHAMEITIVLKAFDTITSSLYKMLLARPAAYFEETFAGELSRRVEQVANSIKFFLEFFPWEIGWPIIALTMTLVLLSTASPWLVLVFLVWLLFFLIPSYFLLRMNFRASQRVSSAHASWSGGVVDVLGNTPVVHAFGREEYEYSRHRRSMDAVLRAERRERILFLINRLNQGVSVVLISIALTLTSVYLFLHGKLSIGGFIIVAATLPTLSAVIWSFGDIIIRTLRSYGELKNSLESLNTDIPTIRGGDEALAADRARVLFKSVSFSYPHSSEKVFDDFTLDIMPGTKVGLVGRSGAGKSTLIKLLLRSYDPTGGIIAIGGHDTKAATLDSLRAAISFVPQDTTLFHRTLYENILYAKPDATKEEVLDASIRAHAHDFIIRYPEGYDVQVGERGVKLSGGQRQRIAIARAMLKNSPLLVLDEATSALDSESEEIVQKGIQDLFCGRTVIAIAHRLSTLRAMDRIVVIEKGRIIEDGSPHELLAKEGGTFKGIWEHQKNGFV